MCLWFKAVSRSSLLLASFLPVYWGHPGINPARGWAFDTSWRIHWQTVHPLQLIYHRAQSTSAVRKPIIHSLPQAQRAGPMQRRLNEWFDVRGCIAVWTDKCRMDVNIVTDLEEDISPSGSFIMYSKTTNRLETTKKKKKVRYN